MFILNEKIFPSKKSLHYFQVFMITPNVLVKINCKFTFNAVFNSIEKMPM